MIQGRELLFEQFIKTDDATKYSLYNVNFLKMRLCSCSGVLFTKSNHFNSFLLVILQHCEQHKVASAISCELDRKIRHPLGACHLDQVPWTVIHYCIALITSGIWSRFPEMLDVIF
jgi:hypothetical protein